MSLRLFQLFVTTLRQNLPKPSNIIRSGVQIRLITEMNAMEPLETNEIVQTKNHTRYKRRYLKRQWEETTKKEPEPGESDEKKICDKPFERIKKKKMALLLGYCGVDYYGMQRNPGVPTIEEDLLKALYDAKYITEEDFNNQQNAHFQRSSRTDKGVSAARQVVSLKLPLDVNIDEINNRLPQCIKVFGIKRATNKFNSKSKCNARTYSYTLPTYVFESSLSSEQERKRYRITAEKMTMVNKVLGFYKGTKSYHNFTEKKHYQDPSSSRYMMSFQLERVFIESEVEFAELLVKGQSFMLHQIRKMVGLMITVVRGQTDIGIMEKAFGKNKVIMPTAPGLGLLLDKVHFEKYDAKFKDSHESLSWDAEEEAVERFKREKIFPIIVKGEIEENSMGLWLEKIKSHSFEPSDNIPDDKNVINDGDDDDDDDDDCDDLESEDVKDSKGEVEVNTGETINSKTGDICSKGDENNVDDIKSKKLITLASDEKTEKLEVSESNCDENVDNEIRSSDSIVR